MQVVCDTRVAPRMNETMQYQNLKLNVVPEPPATSQTMRKNEVQTKDATSPFRSVKSTFLSFLAQKKMN